MKKRAISLLLAVLILFGAVSAGMLPVQAETAAEPATEPVTEPTTEPTEPEDTGSSYVTSDGCIRVLKAFEGFSKYPYYDYGQYTVGYGTRCPDDKYTYYKQNGITEEEAEALLRSHLAGVENEINAFSDKYELGLSQNRFDALVCFSYNCGTGWLYESGVFRSAVVNGATGNEFIQAISLWCNAGGSVLTALVDRRLCEANMYLNGEYASTPPQNYGYVLYDANGGSASPRVQGYDAALTDQPRTTPTYEGYTFDGWYTAKTGGTLVTVLDISVRNTRLYAHWTALPGTETEPEPGGTNITVTHNKVNLRQGPGTNYSIVGMANTGDAFVITETATGSGYTWGKFDGGWICLKYTNYDEVIAQQPSEPEQNEPTEPETTEPSVPETTEPETTEPTVPETSTPTEPSQPEATEPSEPEDTTPAKIMGTVKVTSCLNVRSGAGTGYSIVTDLPNGARVEILEQKMVGAVNWGRIDKGWISLAYVVLDETDKPEDEPSTDNPDSTPDQDTATNSWTGTVNYTFLRIRKGPGTNYGIAGYLYENDRVTITEMKTVGSMIWGKISSGWISMDYIDLDSNGEDVEVLTGKVNYDFLRIRSGPGTSYAIAGYLDEGDRVEILERRTVGSTVWGRIDRGWISLDYIDLDSANSSGSAPTKVVKTVTADCLRIRKEAGTSYAVVGYLYEGAKVEILEAKTVGTTVWGRISNGWISLDYAK